MINAVAQVSSKPFQPLDSVSAPPVDLWSLLQPAGTRHCLDLFDSVKSKGEMLRYPEWPEEPFDCWEDVKGVGDQQSRGVKVKTPALGIGGKICCGRHSTPSMSEEDQRVVAFRRDFVLCDSEWAQ